MPFSCTVETCQKTDDDVVSESPIPEGWQWLGSDGELPISSMSEEGNENFGEHCATSEEDRGAEASAPIVGASLAQELHYSLRDDDVFKHVKSGCCHVAKQSEVDAEDGELVVLRCGKVASRNFVPVEDKGNFMLYKCTRCFSVINS